MTCNLRHPMGKTSGILWVKLQASYGSSPPCTWVPGIHSVCSILLNRLYEHVWYASAYWRDFAHGIHLNRPYQLEWCWCVHERCAGTWVSGIHSVCSILLFRHYDHVWYASAYWRDFAHGMFLNRHCKLVWYECVRVRYAGTWVPRIHSVCSIHLDRYISDMREGLFEGLCLNRHYDERKKWGTRVSRTHRSNSQYASDYLRDSAHGMLLNRHYQLVRYSCAKKEVRYLSIENPQIQWPKCQCLFKKLCPWYTLK